MARPEINSARHGEPPRDERACLDQLRTGDERAFEELFRRYAATLCDFAFSYVRTRETAEEIVQDLFCWIWEQRFTLEMPHGIRAWLFTAVRNRSLNAIRNARTETSLHERYAVNATISPRAPVLADAEVAGRDLAEAAARVIAAMPVRSREAFMLIRGEHMSYAEAARVMGISPKTVEIHMTRALAMLRAGLARFLAP